MCIAVERHVSHLSAYKVLGNSMTLTSMRESTWEQDDLDGKGSLQHPEWQALYLQFSQDHVLGTVPYRWESHYSEAQLMEIAFENLDAVVLSGNMLHDGSITMAEKAAAAKAATGVEHGLLMDMLGQKGLVALVKETETEWELLVPHCLVPSLKFQERVVARWRRHDRIPMSSHWCDVASDSQWMEWHDGLQPDCIPDISQELLPEASACLAHEVQEKSMEAGQEFALVMSEPCETQVPGLWLVNDFLNRDQENELLRSIDECSWKTNRASNRRVQMYGIHHGDQYRVHSKAPITPMPPFIGSLVPDIQSVVYGHFNDHIAYMSKLGIPKVTEVFINEYDPGSSLQFHTDHVVTYEDMIVGVSLGSDTVFRFQSDGREHLISLPRRSIYFMTGRSRTDYKHGMLAGDCHGPRRVSLTFRVVRESAVVK